MMILVGIGAFVAGVVVGAALMLLCFQAAVKSAVADGQLSVTEKGRSTIWLNRS